MSEAAVVIPNWNGMRYLEGCLNSLRKQTCASFDLILVDNGSTDGSVEYIRENYPEAELIALPENTGFCSAVNLGIQKSSAEYVILLNNDTVCDPRFVEKLLEGIKRRPEAFSCCAKMLRMQEPDRIDDAGDFYCALGWAFADGKGKPSSARDSEHKVFASCAGAAVYRKNLLEKTGLFDTGHFAYLEDIDLGYRAQLAGYDSYLLPEAVVYHAGSGTSGAAAHSEFKVKYSSRNSVYLIGKNMPIWQIILNLPFLLAGFLIKTIYFAGKGYGKTYIGGLREGFAMAAESAGNGYRRINRPRFFRVQLQLWRNLLLRLKA